MRNLLLGMMLAAVGGVAQAGGIATVTCGSVAAGIYNNGQTPVLTVSYAPGADAGVPGLFWMGVLAPDQKSGALLVNRDWIAYKGGLYPFQARYDGGLPGAISITVPFPGGALSTSEFVGYSVYVGHGGYTAQAVQAVANRRAVFDRVRANRVAKGTWNSDYDSDERYIWALAQKNMVDNQKFGLVMTVPFVDCAPLGHS